MLEYNSWANGVAVDFHGSSIHNSLEAIKCAVSSSLLPLKQCFPSLNLASSNSTPTKNKIEILSSTTSYTDIKVTCTLDFGEPSTQSSFDYSTDFTDDFVFDELGLFSLDVTTGNEISGTATLPATLLDFNSKCYMLTHVIFHPVQKSLNRIIEIVYTVRIQMQ